MADRDIGILCANEGEKLSDEIKLFNLYVYKALEVSPCLWETSNLNHRNMDLKENAFRQLSLKFNLSPSGVKRQLHTSSEGQQ